MKSKQCPSHVHKQRINRRPWSPDIEILPCTHGPTFINNQRAANAGPTEDCSIGFIITSIPRNKLRWTREQSINEQIVQNARDIYGYHAIYGAANVYEWIRSHPIIYLSGVVLSSLHRFSSAGFVHVIKTQYDMNDFGQANSCKYQ